jgi:hypothetical protein
MKKVIARYCLALLIAITALLQTTESYSLPSIVVDGPEGCNCYYVQTTVDLWPFTYVFHEYRTREQSIFIAGNYTISAFGSIFVRRKLPADWGVNWNKKGLFEVVQDINNYNIILQGNKLIINSEDDFFKILFFNDIGQLIESIETDKHEINIPSSVYGKTIIIIETQTYVQVEKFLIEENN